MKVVKKTLTSYEAYELIDVKRVVNRELFGGVWIGTDKYWFLYEPQKGEKRHSLEIKFYNIGFVPEKGDMIIFGGDNSIRVLTKELFEREFKIVS